MNANIYVFLPARVVALGLAIYFATPVERVQAQSDVVFMTANDVSGDFQLHRFDAGVETLATDTGGNDAFLGVTALNGSVLVANYQANAIERFSPSGAYLGQFTFTGFSPTYLESDSSGNVYTVPVHLIDPAIAWRFDSSGGISQFFSHPSFDRLNGVDADAAGNVYVVEGEVFPTPDRLYKFAPDGTFLNSISLGITGADDLAIDEAGNRLFVADEFGAGLGIRVFDISGAIPVPLGAVLTPAAANIVGLHFASESGNLLATDFGAGSGDPRGLEFSPAGVLLQEYRTANPEFAWDITTFVVPEPTSLAVIITGLLVLGFNARGRRDCE